MAHENEHLEKAYELWRRFRFLILTGIAMILALTVGFTYQKTTFNETRKAANIHLFSALDAADTFTSSEALKHYNALDNFEEFAELKNIAAFSLARISIEDEAVLQTAENALNEVIETTEDNGIKKIAVLRLSEIFMRQDKLNEAIVLLESELPEEVNLFNIIFNERLGDANLLQKNYIEAQLRYTQALIISQRLAEYYVPVLRAKLGVMFSESTNN